MFFLFVFFRCFLFLSENVGKVNVLKFQTLSILFWPNFFLFVQLFLKILSGMANSVDPDQAPPSGPSLLAYAILSDTLVNRILGHLHSNCLSFH